MIDYKYPQSKRRCKCGSGDTYNLDIDSPQAKGLIGEAVVAKVRNIYITAIELDDFNHLYDLSLDKDYGFIQVKTRALYEGKWGSIYFDNSNFDYAFLVCFDKIERIYTISRKELFNRAGVISIFKNSSRGTCYDNPVKGYRMNNEEEMLYNSVYQNLMLYLKDENYFGIEDIKNWLSIK